MKVGEKEVVAEYRLRTKEGAQWLSLFQEKRQAARNDIHNINKIRGDGLMSRLEAEIKAVRLLHGAAKIPRQITLWSKDEPPLPSREQVLIWARDG
jgi:hypothetical protein